MQKAGSRDQKKPAKADTSQCWGQVKEGERAWRRTLPSSACSLLLEHHATSYSFVACIKACNSPSGCQQVHGQTGLSTPWDTTRQREGTDPWHTQ